MAAPQQAADPTAVFGRRVVATLIDAALILIPAFMLVTASFEYLDVSTLDRSPAQFCDDYIADGGFCANFADVDDRVYFTQGTGAAGPAVYWGGTILLLVVIQGLTGWTVGKLVMGIRTVQEDGRPPGLVKAFVRWILWIVDGFPYVLPLLGFIVGLTTQGHRRVGDMAAKTFVVRRSAAGAPILVPGITTPDTGALPYTSSQPWGGAAPATPSADGPQWDAARNTYIQWDPAQGKWLQWDEAARVWSAIPGQ